MNEFLEQGYYHEQTVYVNAIILC